MKRPSNETLIIILVSVMLPAAAGAWWRLYLGYPPIDRAPRVTVVSSVDAR